MKITRNIPEQLIIEQSTTGLLICISLFCATFIIIGLVIISTGSLFGAIFVGLGMILGVVFCMAFARRVQLVLDRPRNRVELRTRSFFGYTATIWALDRLEHAILESTEIAETDKDTKVSTTVELHRAVLIFSEGEDTPKQPATRSYTNGPSAKQTADAINQWLEHARHSSVDSTPSQA